MELYIQVTRSIRQDKTREDLRETGGAKIVNFCLHGPSPAGFGRKGSGSPVLPPVPPPMAKSLGVTISARFCVLGGQNEDKRSNRLNLLVVGAISSAALEPKVRWGRRLDRRDEAVAQFEDPVHIRRRTARRSAKSRPPSNLPTPALPPSPKKKTRTRIQLRIHALRSCGPVRCVKM